MEELQTEAGRSGRRDQLAKMERAIQQVFVAMDAGFRNGRGTIFEFEFVRGASLIKEFLNRFDEIYTLNQDVLLERHYFTEGHGLISPTRWGGYSIPGMRPAASPIAPFTGEREVAYWTPDSKFSLPSHMQPFFKLHGSSNWRDDAGRPIIALGGNKSGAIEASNVLAQYFAHFRTTLASGNARLMIIGYGFHDAHINSLLLDAIFDHNLKLFIIDPLGVGVCDPNRNANLRSPNPFQDGIIGASRRPLQASFGGDRVEHEKILRFFAA